MLTSYATGLLGIAVVLLLWVSVQLAWRRVFPGAFEDPDVLAERTGCGVCERAEVCERRPAEASRAGRECP